MARADTSVREIEKQAIALEVIAETIRDIATVMRVQSVRLGRIETTLLEITSKLGKA